MLEATLAEEPVRGKRDGASRGEAFAGPAIW
jgi:hypothetical protein